MKENNLGLASFLQPVPPKDAIVDVQTNRDNDEFKLRVSTR
jgi:hypothetical protein